METLDGLRRKIDAIDEVILQRLEERTTIVEQVGQYKTRNGDGKSFIRPGREATMLRDLSRKIKGNFPKAAVAAIWRLIISGSLSIEQSMHIAAYRITGEEYCYWLAREYFGAFTPVEAEQEIGQVIGSVAAGKVAVGVLPMPWHEEDSTKWWLGLPDTELKIFACLPFISAETPQAVAIANVQPEPTGDDTTLLAIEITPDAPGKTIETFMKDNGLQVIKQCRAMKGEDTVLLMYIKGFHNEGSAAIQALAEVGGGQKVHMLGAFANSMRLG